MSKKLCSTLATYFLRSPLPWRHPLLHLTCSFRQGDAVTEADIQTVNVTVAELLPALKPQQIRHLLLFSGILADEVGKVEHSGPAQARYHTQMEGEVQDASSLIEYALSYERAEAVMLRREGLGAMLDWVNYAQPVWPTKPEALQHLRDLIEPALTCLTLDDGDEQDELAEEAGRVFTDLLESYTSFFLPQHLETLANIIQQNFGSKLEIELEIGGESDHATVPLIIAYANAVVEDVVEKPTSHRAQVCLQYLSLILRTSSYPGESDTFSSPTIEFWNTYIEYINDLLFSRDSNEPDPVWLGYAHTTLTEVIGLFWKKMQTPPADITKHWADSDKEEFRSFRTDTADLLVSVYLFLGKDLLQQVVRLALTSLQTQSWRPVEAAIFCLNALADNVLEDSESDQALAAFFGSSLFRDIADFSQPVPAQARRTAIDLLGNFGPYIERHAEYLPDAVRFLFASLETGAFASISAKSISSLCSACRHNLTGELDGFLAQYQRFLSGATSDPYTKEKVIGAIAAIIQALAPEGAKAGPLKRLLENVEQDVAFAKERMAGDDRETAEMAGVTALQCLASIGKASQVPDDVPISLYDDDETPAHQASFWDSDEGRAVQRRIMGCFSVLEVLGGHGDAIDAACQVLRSGYTETQPGPFVLPPSITVSFLQQCSINTPQLESVLATACILMSQHSRSNAKRIERDVSAIFQQVTRFIQALGEPRQDPPVAQNCIDVCERLFPHYAVTLLDAPAEQVSLVLGFTLSAIEGPDPMPKRSALAFWATLTKVTGPPVQGLQVGEDVRQKAVHVLVAFGPQLAQALVRQITGLGQRSELDYICEPVKALLSSAPQHSKAWLETALFSNALPATAPDIGIPEKRRFLQQLAGLRGGGKTRDVVKDFYIACRGIVSSYSS